MRLSELDPKLSASGILRFDCPACSPKGHAHGIRVALSPPAPYEYGKTWQRTGEYPETLTLHPSIDAGCWHGQITNGEMIPCASS